MADFGALVGGIGQSGFIGRAIVGLDLDTKKYNSELAAAEGQTKSSTSAMSGIAKAAFLGIGAAAVAGIAVAIKAGSDLNEQLNKSRVVFGDASDAVIKFSESTATGLGIAQSEALEAAGNFGQLFQAAGFAEDAAAGMSQKMVTLSADLGSFNNIPVAEALEKIRSGLAGEAEPLRQLGVFLSEAAVQTEAYRSGIAQQGEDLTDAQKIQARYNIILAETTKAQGDFGRTVGESLPNQLKVLKAELTDVAADLGVALLPIVLDVVKNLKILVPLLKIVAENLGVILTALLAYAAIQFVPGLLLSVAIGLEAIGAAKIATGVLNVAAAITTLGTGLSAMLALDLAGLAYLINKIATGADPTFAEGLGHALAGMAKDQPEVRAQLDATAATVEHLARTHVEAGQRVANFAHMTADELKDWRVDTVAAFNSAIIKLQDLSTESGITERDFIRASEEMKRSARELDRAMQEIRQAKWIPDEYVKFLSEQGPEWIEAFTELNRKQKERAVENWEGSQKASERYKEALDKITGGLKSDLDGKTTKHTVEIHYRYVDFDPSKPGMQVSGRRGGQI